MAQGCFGDDGPVSGIPVTGITFTGIVPRHPELVSGERATVACYPETSCALHAYGPRMTKGWRITVEFGIRTSGGNCDNR
jgi:hypothetical protein